MTRWEYKNAPVGVEDALNALGAEGWELVDVYVQAEVEGAGLGLSLRTERWGLFKRPDPSQPRVRDTVHR